MTTAQLTNIVQKLVIVIAGILMQHGYTQAASLLNTTTVVSFIVGALVFWWSHRSNSVKAILAKADDVTPAQLLDAGKILMALLLPVLLLTGCTSVVNTPQGKILSITERGVGFHVVTSSASSSTPNVDFGFWSSAVVIIPTSTNGPVNSPNFANTFDFDQTGALQLGIGENIASGNFQTLKTGTTNSAVVTQPITPK